MYSRSSSHSQITPIKPAEPRQESKAEQTTTKSNNELDENVVIEPKENTKEDEKIAEEPASTRRRIRAPVASGEALNWAAKPLAAPMGLVKTDEAAYKAKRRAFETEANKLYGKIPDDLEDLTADERDALLSRAFKHEALRAKRPCIWIPRDPLGVSDDEVANTAKLSPYIWISNVKQGLDKKGNCYYTGPPPDFDEVDLIQL